MSARQLRAARAARRAANAVYDHRDPFAPATRAEARRASKNEYERVMLTGVAPEPHEELGGEA